MAQSSGWRPTAGELAELHRRAVELVDLEIDAAIFARTLAANPNLERPPADDGLIEIALAAGCDAGLAAAERQVADRYLSAADEALAHMRLPGALADDVRQKVLEKLLVSDDDSPSKLAGYAGQGTLRGLIKVVAVRTALSELRKNRREAPMPEAGPDIFEATADSADPELAFVKQRYRAEFKVAFEEAVAGLSDRERNLLRLHLLRGVTLEALAEIYGVHRATVTRWLARARERVMDSTREHLGARLDIGRSQIDTVMNWIGSRLDASVSRVLRTRSPSDDSSQR
jgi:RNA polymerase sigma-70 factor (ECF subfamily)